MAKKPNLVISRKSPQSFRGNRVIALQQTNKESESKIIMTQIKQVANMTGKILFSRMTIVKASGEKEAKVNLASLAGECVFAGELNAEPKEGLAIFFKWSVEPYEDLFASLASEEIQAPKIRISLEVWQSP